MKTLTGIFGAMLVIGSFVLFFVAFALSNTRNAPVWTIVIVGIVGLIVGIMLDHSASGKTCPRCSERVKSAAHVCRYCKHEFA